MMPRWCWLLALMLALVAWNAGWAADAGGDEMRQLGEWYDGLGFKDTTKAPLIRIHTGKKHIINGGHGALRTEVSLGWLLEDQGETFRAVLPDLSVAHFVKWGKEESEDGFCGYREVSLEEEVKGLVRELNKPDYLSHWRFETHWSSCNRLPRGAQIFALARACEKKGHEKLAKELMQALQAHPDSGMDTLRKDLTEARIGQLRLDFRDPKKSWADLLVECRAMGKDDPKEWDRWRITAMDHMRTGLEQLAAEDAARAGQKPVVLETLAPPERAKELVRRLRDEVDSRSREKFSSPYALPWAEPRVSNGAMEELRKMDFAAVPALLEEMRMPHLSRAVYPTQEALFGVHLDNTGVLSMRLIGELAGIDFYRLTGVPDFLDSGSERWEPPAVIQKGMEDWWTGVQAKGEKQWLVDMVATGEEASYVCAPRLRDKYPEAAAASLVADLPRAADVSRRYSLVNLLCGEKGKPPGAGAMTAYLRKVLSTDSILENRLAAAEGLRKLGAADGDLPLLVEWRKFMGEKKATDVDEPNVTHCFVARYLAGSNSPEVLHELLDAWPKLLPEMRVAVIGGLMEAAESELVRARSPDRAHVPDPDHDVAQTLVREILLTALEDTTDLFEFHQLSFRGGGMRLCDEAAMILHEKWEKKFVFDERATEPEQERQRIALVNINRSELGLPPLPLPPARDKVPADQARNVIAVEWGKASAAAPKEMAAKLEALKGKPLSSKPLFEFVVSYLAAPNPGTKRLGLHLVRAGDDTGVTLRLNLCPGNVEKPESYRYLYNGYSRHAAGLFAMGTRKLPSGLDPKPWAFVELQLQSALDAPPDSRLDFHLVVELE